MTEEEWRASIDPWQMLSFVGGQASEQQLRLFALACCRRIEHLLSEDQSRQAVGVCARYVEGRASEEELTQAVTAAFHAAMRCRGQPQRGTATSTV
jgi:hypothetical protein